MTILWEMTAWPGENAGCYTCADQKDLWARTFLTDGKPKHWPTRPALVAGVEPRRKKPFPIPPIGHIALASIVLQPHAVAVLGQFLGQFGELLDVEYAGGLVYLYNVTTLVSCVDQENSRKDPTGAAIIRPAFRPDAIPAGPVIFKDPLTATTRLYVTPAARHIIEPLALQNRLAGLTFYEAGTK